MIVTEKFSLCRCDSFSITKGFFRWAKKNYNWYRSGGQQCWSFPIKKENRSFSHSRWQCCSSVRRYRWQSRNRFRADRPLTIKLANSGTNHLLLIQRKMGREEWLPCREQIILHPWSPVWSYCVVKWRKRQRVFREGACTPSPESRCLLVLMKNNERIQKLAGELAQTSGSSFANRTYGSFSCLVLGRKAKALRLVYDLEEDVWRLMGIYRKGHGVLANAGDVATGGSLLPYDLPNTIKEKFLQTCHCLSQHFIELVASAAAAEAAKIRLSTEADVKYRRI